MNKQVHSWGRCSFCDKPGYVLAYYSRKGDTFVVDACNPCLEKYNKAVMQLTADPLTPVCEQPKTTGGSTVSNSMFVVADDGLLYKDPTVAGMIDEEVGEFFICFSDSEPPEVVIESIKNYPPHKGLDSKNLWRWYGTGAATILTQLGFKVEGLRKAMVCDRMFLCKDKDDAENRTRQARAFSFYFDLIGPIPAGAITQHHGTLPLDEEARPEGTFLLLVPDEAFAPLEQSVAGDPDFIPDNPILTLPTPKANPSVWPEGTPQEVIDRSDRFATGKETEEDREIARDLNPEIRGPDNPSSLGDEG